MECALRDSSTQGVACAVPTSTLGMVRSAGEGAQWLSDRATKLDSPVGIADLKTKGHHRTFRVWAAGGEIRKWRSHVPGQTEHDQRVGWVWNHYANALGIPVAHKGGAVGDFARGVPPAPRAASPAPASRRGRAGGVGARLSTTKGIPGRRGVVQMLWAQVWYARVALSPIAARCRPRPQDCPPHTQLPHQRMSVAGHRGPTGASGARRNTRRAP
eukprot:3447642-Prymnesium_polylepis.2